MHPLRPRRNTLPPGFATKPDTDTVRLALRTVAFALPLGRIGKAMAGTAQEPPETI